MKKGEIVSSRRTPEEKGAIVIGPHAMEGNLIVRPADTLPGNASRREYFKFLKDMYAARKAEFRF